MRPRALSTLILAIPLMTVAGFWLAVRGGSPGLPFYASDKAISSPVLWGEGVISTRDDEFGAQIVPDKADAGSGSLFFSRSVPRSQFYTILLSRYRQGRWSEPAIAPFSGTWRDCDPSLTPDGSRLYFASDRPRDGKPASDLDLGTSSARVPAGARRGISKGLPTAPASSTSPRRPATARSISPRIVPAARGRSTSTARVS